MSSDGIKLLGSIIDTGSIRILREVPRDLFIEDELPVYDYIRSHYRQYGNIPAIATVEEELDLRIPEVEEVPSYYVRRLNDRKMYSDLRGHYENLKESMRAYNMEEARTIIAAMHADARVHRRDSDIKNLREALSDVIDEYDYAHENPGVSGVPTLWPSFDYPTGGCQAGDLITWVARPSMGKTYLMLRQVQAAWAMGYSVLLVSMEMTIAQITRRLAALHAGINPKYIRKGMLSTYARRRLDSCISSLQGVDRLQIFSGGLRKTAGDVELLIQEFEPDIVYIDGVYLMQPSVKRSMQKVERVSEIFDELKQMTIAHDVPVVVTTQFNRQAGKKGKEGSLENIAFTDAISTHSSLVLSVAEGRGGASEAAGKRVVKFLKGREGEEGEFEINYKFAPIDFTEITDSRSDGSVDEDGNVVEGTPRTATSSIDFMHG